MKLSLFFSIRQILTRAVLLSFLACLGFANQALAGLADGIYTGVYKVVWVGGDTDSKVGDSSVFNFEIKDNKVVDINGPKGDVINSAKIRSEIVINEDRLEGAAYIDFVDSGYPITIKFQVDGLVADQSFIGKAAISLIAVNNQMMGDQVIEKMIFESD